MALIHHVISGHGRPPIVFVHGFACTHGDWDAQVAHLASHRQTIAVDLRGHGASPGTGDKPSIEQYGTDVADLMQALGLPPAVLVGHSMGCRVVVEAALQAPAHVTGVVLIDGSQFAAAMEATLNDAFAKPNGYETLIGHWFRDMFTPGSDAAVAPAVIERARRLPRTIGEQLMIAMLRYDVDRLGAALAGLRVPVLAIQTTYSDERRERRSMRKDQDTPYLALLRTRVPSVRFEIIPDTGHFPQIDRSAETNLLIEQFVARLPAA